LEGEQAQAQTRRRNTSHTISSLHGKNRLRCVSGEYKGGFFSVKGVKIPVAVTVYPGEQYQAPRSWTEKAYPKLIYYHEAAKGGHFAAWEEPQIFAEEMRAAFKSVR
jgi:hypothetical protein